MRSLVLHGLLLSAFSAFSVPLLLFGILVHLFLPARYTAVNTRTGLVAGGRVPVFDDLFLIFLAQSRDLDVLSGTSSR
jgi:hypothetical protein